MNDLSYIGRNLSHVLERVAYCAGLVNRPAEEITVIAVTKTVGVPEINEAVNCGIQHLGENRVQEYLQKKDEIYRKIFWHLIGQMQTNKLKYIIGAISLLQSLDRLHLALEIERLCQSRNLECNALIEINIAREESKAGIDIDELDSFIEQLSAYPHIKVKGLMTVAPFSQDKAFVRKCFEKMYRQFERLKKFQTENCRMQYLSMGMSADYEEALLEGSNMLRIGSAIFGERPKK